jgi:hypothetical protein
MEKVEANRAIILKDSEEIYARREKILANHEKIAANQARIAALIDG